MYARIAPVAEAGVDDGVGTEIDLRDRLRFAAGSLAADLGPGLTVDHAEELVFSSAEGLLAAASVTEFVPILAERRARLAIRSAAMARSAAPAPASPVRSEPALPARPAPATPTPAPPSAAVTPLMAVPDRDITRLHNEIERARMRLADWRSDLGQRTEPVA
jgi:hypothetical protein